jgi:hypothetical protein
VLVRPDRHVAWRCDELPPDPAGALTEVMRQVLGLIPAEQPSTPTPVRHATVSQGARS